MNENFDLTLRWILEIVWNGHGVQRFIFLEEYLIYVEYMIILLVRISSILHHVLLIHSRLINEVKRIYVKRIFCHNKTHITITETLQKSAIKIVKI